MPATIRKSSRGTTVAHLQLLLNRAQALVPPLVPDGIFGSGTEQAVKTFQAKHGLGDDGIVGPKSWNKLLSFADKYPTEFIRGNAKGWEVGALQAMLNVALNLKPGLETDGKYGPNTEKVVRQFQAIADIGIDGVVGPETWKTLEAWIIEDKEVRIKVAPTPAPVPSPSTAMKGAATWLKFAKDEMGQKEIKGPTHNPRIVEYHSTTTYNAKTDEVPWCASFVNWVIIKAGLKGTNSAAADSWLKWGVACEAKPGAVAIIRNAKAANSSLTYSGNHVGFLIKETAKHYVLLGGNQSDQVKISYFPKSSWNLRGYRWAKEEDK